MRNISRIVFNYSVMDDRHIEMMSIGFQSSRTIEKGATAGSVFQDVLI